MYHVTIYYVTGQTRIVRVQATSRGHAIAQARWMGHPAKVDRYSAVKVG